MVPYGFNATAFPAYVWHCHILSHEENEMMRPMVFWVARRLPPAPALSGIRRPSRVNLTWTDGTPAAISRGNPGNEIGFRIQRATGSGALVEIGRALANATFYVDTTIDPTATYRYRVVAFNAAGNSASNIIVMAPPP